VRHHTQIFGFGAADFSGTVDSPMLRNWCRQSDGYASCDQGGIQTGPNELESL
jgi:hypothetical protein